MFISNKNIEFVLSIVPYFSIFIYCLEIRFLLLIYSYQKQIIKLILRFLGGKITHSNTQCAFTMVVLAITPVLGHFLKRFFLNGNWPRVKAIWVRVVRPSRFLQADAQSIPSPLYEATRDSRSRVEAIPLIQSAVSEE